MADNYLGRKMEEYYSKKNAQSNSKGGSYANLSKLLLKNSSFRGFNSEYIVTVEQLTKIISINTLTTSVCDQQWLRFRPTCQDEAEKVLNSISVRGTLFSSKEFEPNAFVVICSTENEDRIVDIELGISLQTMLLKAAEMGLTGIGIISFDKEMIARDFGLKMEPLLIVAIGKEHQNGNAGTEAISHSRIYEINKDDLIIK